MEAKQEKRDRYLECIKDINKEELVYIDCHCQLKWDQQIAPKWGHFF